MKRNITILLAILGVQLLLVLILFANNRDMGVFQSNEKLLNLKLDALDKIEIAAEAQQLTLSKPQQQWIIKDHFDSPVSLDKLKQLTDKILALNSSWPVATTEAAALRFKVAEQQFVRKISFFKDDKVLHTLYLGTSPGFKKIHARVDQQANVYSVALSAFEFSTDADDWVDKDLLQVNQESLQQIAMPGFTLSKQNETWQISPLAAGQQPNQAAITTLIDKLSRLQFLSIEGIDAKTEFALDNPTLRYSLTDASGKQIDYAFGKMAEKEEYILKTSALPYYFKLTQATVKPMLDTQLASLLQAKAAEKPASTNSSDLATKPKDATTATVE